MASQDYYPRRQPIITQPQVDDPGARHRPPRPYDAQLPLQDAQPPHNPTDSGRHRPPHDSYMQTLESHQPTYDSQGHARDTWQPVSQSRPSDTQRRTQDSADGNRQGQSYSPEQLPHNRQARAFGGADINQRPSYDLYGQPPDTVPGGYQRDTFSAQPEQADSHGQFYNVQMSTQERPANNYREPIPGARQFTHDRASSMHFVPTQSRVFGEDLTGLVRILPNPEGIFPLSLATGAFSNVFKGEYRKSTTPGRADAGSILVAVKIFRVSEKDGSKLTAKDINRRLIRESDVWLRLKHPNIQPYLGHCSDLDQCVALISPFCGNSTILDYIAKNTETNRLRLVKDVIKGLQYLDLKGVIHGDLHCHNVLVNEAGSAVLTDFGRAKVIGEAGFSTTMFAGHITSMAPELLPPDDSVDLDKLFSKKSDIYAFGMLCYKTFTNEDPFASYNVSQDHQIVLLVHKGAKPKLTDHVKSCISQDMWRIMVACWKTTPKDRPSADQIIQDMH